LKIPFCHHEYSWRYIDAFLCKNFALIPTFGKLKKAGVKGMEFVLSEKGKNNGICL
jgi:hypothetical protein